MARRTPMPSPWRRELDDLFRAIAGAFLFGAPFIYTMEVWWAGNFSDPHVLLGALGLSFAALVILAYVTGFRAQRETDLVGAIKDSVEALALALLLALVALVLLRRIGIGTGFQPIIGKIVLEAVPLSIGIGLANGLLRKGDDDQDVQSSTTDNDDWTNDHSWKGTLTDAGATALGATIIAFAIAPTDEIPMIAASMTGPWLLALILVSLALSYVIVFEADFGAQQARVQRPGVFQRPLDETVFSYLVALGTSVVMLWLFALIRPGDPPAQTLTYVIVLGLPATIGGAAGRVLI